MTQDNALDATANSILYDQHLFMRKAGQQVDIPDRQQADLYSTLVEEEYGEFADTQVATYAGASVADDIKEAVDVIVVAAGYLISRLGYEGAEKAWELVYQNNLKKLAGKIEKREDGKVMKGATDKAEIKKQLLKSLETLL